MTSRTAESIAERGTLRAKVWSPLDGISDSVFSLLRKDGASYVRDNVEEQVFSKTWARGLEIRSDRDREAS